MAQDERSTITMPVTIEVPGDVFEEAAEEFRTAKYEKGREDADLDEFLLDRVELEPEWVRE